MLAYIINIIIHLYTPPRAFDYYTKILNFLLDKKVQTYLTIIFLSTTCTCPS